MFFFNVFLIYIPHKTSLIQDTSKPFAETLVSLLSEIYEIDCFHDLYLKIPDKFSF